jgi:hypothetical protein
MNKIRNRYAASFLHFAISLAIFSIFLLVLLTYWYPAPFFTASGGLQGLKIVAAIDLVLGPALTLIIYNINKSKLELFTDFSIIGFIQIAALTWGITTVYNQRPVAAVFWEDGFYTVPASAFEKLGVDLAVLGKYGDEKPLYIFAEQPQTVEEKQELIESILTEHIPPYHQIKRFRPIESHYEDIFKHGVDINEIIKNNVAMRKEVDGVISLNNTSLNDNHYISLKSKYRNIILIFNQAGKLLGTASAPLKDAT